MRFESFEFASLVKIITLDTSISMFNSCVADRLLRQECDKDNLQFVPEKY